MFLRESKSKAESSLIRTRELFDIIIEYPRSQAALQDLAVRTSVGICSSAWKKWLTISKSNKRYVYKRRINVLRSSFISSQSSERDYCIQVPILNLLSTFTFPPFDRYAY